VSRKIFTLLVVSLLVSGSALFASDEEKKPQAKYPISGGDVSKDASTDYKGANVYFCCAGCISKFQGDIAKYAAKANEQLLVTEQAPQKSCPFSGGKLNPDTALKVDGISVCFCCNGCKDKVAKAEHGFGARLNDRTCSTWMRSCEAWMRHQGLLKPQ